eukprot:TRINITY_DN14421_c0_g1_i1.p1 TRINITY_DN14421_c0_g1~~TRINITY_DN14421_c0_g1_i1.p1  ORF type:complete len:823 (-),score=164.15 TRINITY_DN14421_c0_g1_i1:110-2578(-)
MQHRHKIMASACLLLAIVAAIAFSSVAAMPVSPRVRSLVKSMTLQEKVGQMTQLDIDLFVKLANPRELDLQRTRYFARNLKLGSILNSPSAARPLAVLSIDEYRGIVETVQQIFREEGVLPVLFGLDCVHGASYLADTALFPQQIGLAATFNTTHARIMGEITAKDTRAAGVPWNFSPILDLSSNFMWSRTWETFGEDPVLTSAMGVEYIKGSQGYPPKLNDPTKVAATAKHFIGYGAQRGGDRTPAQISDRFLLEYFVPSFEAAIKDAQVATTMEAYLEINGVPVVASKQYLNDLLRDHLNFTGMLVTDWAEIHNLYDFHKVTPTKKEAVRLSLQSTSIDMSMTALDPSFFDSLVELVQEGTIPESRLDESVERILQLKEDMGLLDSYFDNQKQAPAYPKRNVEADRQAALETCRESITLLQNKDSLLPLSSSSTTRPIRRVLVTGPTAHSRRYQNGGWTLHHQGAYYEEEFSFGSTVLDGINSVIDRTQVTVTYEPGCDIKGACDPARLAAAVDAARSSDVAIVCVGESTYAEKPGDIRDQTLEIGQLDLARQIAATGTPVVLVLIQGRPRYLADLPDLAHAVIYAYLPGLEGGQAIAEIIFGVTNPSGKLPISYPGYSASVPMPYWHRPSEADSYYPQWAFGHGLSYTTFTYTDLSVSPSVVQPGQPISVSVTVANTGSVSGKETVLLFLSDEYRIITPEVKRLRRFEKVNLAPRESTRVTFTLETKDLSFIGIDLSRQVEAGRFFVSVGGLTAPFELQIPSVQESQTGHKLARIDDRLPFQSTSESSNMSSLPIFPIASAFVTGMLVMFAINRIAVRA